MDNQSFAIVPYSMDGIGGECVAQNDRPFGMTDRQVGEALGYADPDKAIQNVIARNIEELSVEGLSVTLKLRATDGKRYNTRTWTKEGVIRIAFLASTEKSKLVRAVAAKLFVAYAEGKLNGNNPNTRIGEARKVLKDSLAIMGMAGRYLGIDKPTQFLTAARKTREETGVDVVEEFKLLLPAPADSHRLMTPTEIGRTFDPPISAKAINSCLVGMGFQSKVGISGKDDWEWVGNPEKNELWHKRMVDGNGTRFQLCWHDTVIPLIQDHMAPVEKVS